MVFPMFGRLALLFVFVPLIELMLLIKLSAKVGFGPTLLLVVITGLIGAWLARDQGFKAVGRIQAELAAARSQLAGQGQSVAEVQRLERDLAKLKRDLTTSQSQVETLSEENRRIPVLEARIAKL